MKKINWFTIIKMAALTLAVAALSVTGIALGVNGLREAEYRDASYDRNGADYYVIPQGDNDVVNLNAQSFVNEAVGFYNIPKTVNGNNGAAKTNLLFADDLTKAEGVSFFNRDTLMSGALGEGGIYLDKKAADNLGVDVGDTISYDFSSRKIDAEVKAIFLPCYIPLLDQGVALLQWTDAHEAAASENLSYGVIMIDAADNSLTYEYLVSQGYGVTITVLANVKKSVSETSDIYEVRALRSYIALAVSATAIFAAFGILLILLNKKYDLNGIAKGKKSAEILRGLVFRYAIAGAVAVALSGVFGAVYATNVFWFDSFLPAVLIPALLPLAGLIAIFAYIFLFYKKTLERAPLPAEFSSVTAEESAKTDDAAPQATKEETSKSDKSEEKENNEEEQK